ncbi:uncharacterized protein LOC129719802 [Wyeomyia smithii]|uniref:uncharacterized protein LOC129719802 n=1 Tax=Wyeomyia smithii TaxID=174621 RepID=UPI002467D840|nr:uncharacterized protein LOC129719802 [Wyeomyia smithii]
MKYKLTSYNAVCPRIYGQPKAHKPNIPLRPVVPNTTAPTYDLCEYIADILQRSLTSQYNARDSKSFCEYINNLSIPADHILVSFDVASLFTNVTKDVVTHDIIMMWSNIKEHTGINLDFFLEIIEFCLGASFFYFRGKFYRQINGLAMGSPLSPILAGIVMENLVTKAITQAHVPVQFIRKYVDDLFLVLHKDQVDHTLAIFNEQNPNIKFTCEKEDRGRLPFLDLLVVRHDDGSIKTDWYAKLISSGRILNYHSFHSTDQKLAVVRNFIDRVRGLSTIKTDEEKNQVIYSQLRKNDYPHKLICRMLIQPARDDRLEKPSSFKSSPFIHGLSTTIKKILQNSDPTTSISFSNQNTVGHLYHTAKDPVPYKNKSNVVYQIACRDCHGKYIGMTSNKLRCRMYGHQSHVNTLDKLLPNGHQNEEHEIQQLQGETAMIDHCIQYNHRFDLNTPAILDSAYKTQALQVLEMCHIATTTNTVNHRTDADNLSCAYANLLLSIKYRREMSTAKTAAVTKKGASILV